MKLIRPMALIYEEAAKIAEGVQERALKAVEAATNAEDRLIAQDIAYSSKRFLLKARLAVNEVKLLREDGTLRAYCEQFDKVFHAFLKTMEAHEADLNRMQSH